MRTVTLALFEPEELREVNRARRWLGLHPRANEPLDPKLHFSILKRYPAATYRTLGTSMLTGLVEAGESEPVTRDRLLRLLTYLDETRDYAFFESDPGVWLGRAALADDAEASDAERRQAEVLAESRAEAVHDLDAIMELLAGWINTLPNEPIGSRAERKYASA